MKKVCQNWATEAFDDNLVNGSYWEAFEQNAKNASAEIIHAEDLSSAQAAIADLIVTLKAKSIIATGDEASPELASVYKGIETMGTPIYTNKFAIAEHAPTADLGISTAEFCVGETGSVCVDAYSYEARVVGMLPPTHIIILNKNHTVKNVTTAFQVISRVFKRGYMGFITGPSRTADIERVLSLGVHGPSRFFIIAVDKMENRRVQ
jgi:Uncharacterized conserved protein